MSIRHILTCVDLSPHAVSVTTVASRLAERLGADITLFHTDPNPPAGAEDSTLWRRFAAGYAAGREQAADRLGEDVRGRGVGFDFLTLIGAPRHTILEAAQFKHTDLIVLGSGVEDEDRGIGSTVSRVLRLAEVPVLVVPTRGEPQRRWDLDRILAPSDFQETSEAGLRRVRDLAHTLGCGVSVATVVHWPRKTGFLAVQDGAAEIPELIAHLVEDARIALVEQARSVGLTTALPHVVGGDRPADALADLALELGCGLIALPSLGKGALARILLGSTTERLVGVSPVPVLVFPRAYLEHS
ncbi:MAG: universal stress protein [Deltaproteobacteria bacterium]|nr:MAG: universal stress protein [Deltaproteobacteria bacterium]